jgi:hypothetical protein
MSSHLCTIQSKELFYISVAVKQAVCMEVASSKVSNMAVWEMHVAYHSTSQSATGVIPARLRLGKQIQLLTNSLILRFLSEKTAVRQRHIACSQGANSRTIWQRRSTVTAMLVNLKSKLATQCDFTCPSASQNLNHCNY